MASLQLHPPPSSPLPPPHPDHKDSTNNEHPESEKKELWSFHDTSLLLDLYEAIFVMLGRGMVRKEDWKRMAEQLSLQSGSAKSAEQCKNRIEYLRKQYRKEKVKYLRSSAESSWIFYKRLEALVDDASKGAEVSKETAIRGGGVRHREPEGHCDALVFSRAKDEPTSPAQQNSHLVDSPDEEETVATTKGQEASTQGMSYKPGRKRRKLMASLGKDLKEGLSQFAAVIERIERTKMELVLMLERQRSEQEHKRAEMEMERTRMLLQNQLEMAKLFCASRTQAEKGGNNNA